MINTINNLKEIGVNENQILINWIGQAGFKSIL